MKKELLLAIALAAASHGWAQDSDSLAATLPSGQVIHFETEEQKAKFLAARARMASSSPAPAAATAAPATAPGAARSTADATPQMNGKVNVSAPTFTADYYLFAPETWEGKQVTVSVAYIRRENSTRSDGLVELLANTYGILQATGEQRRGGDLMIVATEAAAQRISSLAGTRYQSGTVGTKTTLLKGTFKKSEVGRKGYFLYVDK